MKQAYSMGFKQGVIARVQQGSYGTVCSRGCSMGYSRGYQQDGGVAARGPQQGAQQEYVAGIGAAAGQQQDTKRACSGGLSSAYKGG